MPSRASSAARRTCSPRSGFVAIFAGASNTPLACTIMGIELFGATNTVYIAVACFVAYLCSGHSGIYLAQRLAVPKTSGGAIPPDIALRHVREIGSRSVDGFDLPFPRGGGALFSDPNPEEDQTVMPHAHHVSAKEIGMLRIYLKPKERFRDEAGRPHQGRAVGQAALPGARATGQAGRSHERDGPSHALRLQQPWRRSPRARWRA